MQHNTVCAAEHSKHHTCVQMNLYSIIHLTGNEPAIPVALGPGSPAQNPLTNAFR